MTDETTLKDRDGMYLDAADWHTVREAVATLARVVKRRKKGALSVELGHLVLDGECNGTWSVKVWAGSNPEATEGGG